MGRYIFKSSSTSSHKTPIAVFDNGPETSNESSCIPGPINVHLDSSLWWDTPSGGVPQPTVSFRTCIGGLSKLQPPLDGLISAYLGRFQFFLPEFHVHCPP
ncbi:hypothetical protein FF1_000670 [Malus domestica]